MVPVFVVEGGSSQDHADLASPLAFVTPPRDYKRSVSRLLKIGVLFNANNYNFNYSGDPKTGHPNSGNIKKQTCSYPIFKGPTPFKNRTKNVQFLDPHCIVIVEICQHY